MNDVWLITEKATVEGQIWDFTTLPLVFVIDEALTLADFLVYLRILG